MERLTHSNNHPGLKSPNPVVSDDGRYMAFQTARVGRVAGAGQGTFLHDLAKAPKAQR